MLALNLRLFGLRLFLLLLQCLLLLLTGKRLRLFLLEPGIHAVAEVGQLRLDGLLRLHPAMKPAQQFIQPRLHLRGGRSCLLLRLVFLWGGLGLLFLGRIAEQGTGPLLDVFRKGDGTVFDLVGELPGGGDELVQTAQLPGLALLHLSNLLLRSPFPKFDHLVRAQVRRRQLSPLLPQPIDLPVPLHRFGTIATKKAIKEAAAAEVAAIRKTTAEKVAALKSSERRLRALDIREQKRRENHAKILVGVAMIHHFQISEGSAGKFKALLEEFYSNSADRLKASLFGLTLAVKKTAATRNRTNRQTYKLSVYCLTLSIGRPFNQLPPFQQTGDYCK